MPYQSKLKNLALKKVSCPVTFTVKKIYSFLEHKILADTKD